MNWESVPSLPPPSEGELLLALSCRARLPGPPCPPASPGLQGSCPRSPPRAQDPSSHKSLRSYAAALDMGKHVALVPPAPPGRGDDVRGFQQASVTEQSWFNSFSHAV